MLLFRPLNSELQQVRFWEPECRKSGGRSQSDPTGSSYTPYCMSRSRVFGALSSWRREYMEHEFMTPGYKANHAWRTKESISQLAETGAQRHFTTIESRKPKKILEMLEQSIGKHNLKFFGSHKIKSSGLASRDAFVHFNG
jgi:hypothetical protein